MVEMTVNRIGMNQQGQALVILGDAEGERLLPIWIGHFEAHAIAIEMEGAPFDRPLTHDLFTNTLEALGERLEKVEITKLQDRVFYAVLHITDGERVLELDARPSDAVALAVRAQARILVAEAVLDVAQVRMSEIEDTDEVDKFRALMEQAEVFRQGRGDPESLEDTDELPDEESGMEDAE